MELVTADVQRHCCMHCKDAYLVAGDVNVHQLQHGLAQRHLRVVHTHIGFEGLGGTPVCNRTEQAVMQDSGTMTTAASRPNPGLLAWGVSLPADNLVCKDPHHLQPQRRKESYHAVPSNELSLPRNPAPP